MRKLNKFFVYGTLMKGCSNHYVFEEDSIISIEEATVTGWNLHMYESGSFPCLVPAMNQYSYVYGQLITISNEHLEKTIDTLDRLEGYFEPDSEHNFYDRVKSLCKTSKGSYEECYIYIFNEDNEGLGEHIESGRFKQFLNSKGRV